MLCAFKRKRSKPKLLLGCSLGRGKLVDYRDRANRVNNDRKGAQSGLELVPRGRREESASVPRVSRLGGLFDLALFHFLAEPFAVMAPAPAAGHRATRHSTQRAAYPDRCIDVDNPDSDGEHGR